MFNSFHGENITDLSHAPGGYGTFRHGREVVGARRQQGKILAVFGSFKVMRFPFERTGDDPAHAVRSRTELPRLFTEAVKFLMGINILVAGDLQNAVGGSVDDGLFRSQMLFAVILDHRRTGIRLVAEDLTAESRFQFLYEIPGKTLGKNGKPFFQNDAHHFPMPRGGVFAAGGQRRFAVGTDRGIRRRNPFNLPDVPKTETAAVGQ